MSDHFEWDPKLPGFGTRTRNGRKSYVVQYKVGPKQRRMTLHRGHTLASARKEAQKIFGEVAKGKDPQGEKKDARQIGTFKAVAEEFIAFQKEQRRASTVYCTELYLLGTKDHPNCRPLHAMPIDAIKRTDVANVLRSIKNASGPVSADRGRAALSSMFAWAIGEGLCGETYANPVIGTNKQAGDYQPRGRALKKEEIAALWNAVDGTADHDRIIKLLLLTGCRRNEIAKLEWSEVGDDLISLPGDRTKNHLPFDVPLTDMMREVIGPRPEEPSRFVFGRRSSGFSGFSKAKRELDAKLALAPWRLHDIRHTVSTMMSEIGIDPHIVEACLNHISGPSKAGVAGVYNHAKYNPQKRKALEEWASRISVILAQASGANVEARQGHGA